MLMCIFAQTIVVTGAQLMSFCCLALRRAWVVLWIAHVITVDNASSELILLMVLFLMFHATSEA